MLPTASAHLCRDGGETFGSMELDKEVLRRGRDHLKHLYDVQCEASSPFLMELRL